MLGSCRTGVLLRQEVALAVGLLAPPTHNRQEVQVVTVRPAMQTYKVRPKLPENTGFTNTAQCGAIVRIVAQPEPLAATAPREDNTLNKIGQLLTLENFCFT